MDIIWNALQYSLVLDLVVACIAIYALSQLTSRSYSDVRPEDLVPEHKRFERREGDTGDRRHPRAMPFPGRERRFSERRISA